MRDYCEFVPDLIIEATAVCDRACLGCYAPNVVSKESADKLYHKNPDLFLNPNLIKNILDQFSHQELATISIRGGEPTRHPKLNKIFEYCKNAACSVVLETHGRWLLMDTKESEDLLSSLVKHQVTVKISFDEMHGLDTADLRTITEALEVHRVSYLVAITENTKQEFLRTRSLCSWILDSQIIFQRKVFSQEGLLKPACGVLSVDGNLVGHLHTRGAAWLIKTQERAFV